jgi:uncharacterized membrane protein YeaQ/YmgE (transglycosylase-associated protein family)
MRGRGFGVLKNILVGIVGSVVTATVGAILILYLVKWVQAP